MDVVGHSLGGMFAAELAAVAPHLVRRLVLGQPTPGFPIAEREEPHASPGWSYFILDALLSELQAPQPKMQKD